jgi:serine/threonine protein kinase
LDYDGFSWLERLQVFRDAVKGTHQMHLRNVVYRDLKSENVLVFSRGHSGLQAKVADLGRARITTEPPRYLADDYLAGRGDLRFAAPELLWLQGATTEAAWRAVDLYHLGSLLFEIVTGVGITSAVLPDSQTIIRHANSMDPASRTIAYTTAMPDLRDRYAFAYEMFASEVPPAICAQAVWLLRKLTALDREQRFPSIQGKPQKGVGLEWLMRRVDILTLTLRNAQRQARRTELRKEST